MSNINKIRGNERSHVINLISAINQFLSQTDLIIKSAGGEISLTDTKENTTRFPDLLLYGDTENISVLQGWELKLPDTPINDEEFILDSQNKADLLGLNSTIIWNFQYVVLYIKNAHGIWEEKKRWNDLRHIDTRKKVDIYREDWLQFLNLFLVDLNEYFLTNEIKSRNLVEVTENISENLVTINKPLVSTYLKDKSKSKRIIDVFISNWWRSVSKEFAHDEKDKYQAYSKIILMGWVTRFIFAHSIKNVHNSARKLDSFNDETTPKTANKVFVKITESSDFYTVFENKKYDDELPTTTWQYLLEFNSFLADKNINHSLMQQLLEKSINRYKRELNGQFTTPEKLAKLLVNTTIENATGNDIDPCCGTGTISREIMTLKRKTGIQLKQIHDTTWASDKIGLPLQISNVSMTQPESMNMLNKVFQMNVFDLETGNTIEFRSPEDGKIYKESLPKFTNIISNLPFVRNEIVNKDETSLIQDVINQIYQVTNGSLTLGKKADYYAYIVFKLKDILEEDGKVGIITSNSWLGTDWGKAFFKILQYFYSVEKIIISSNGKWFYNADVIASILVIKNKKNGQPNNDSEIQFSNIKKNLNTLDEEDIIITSEDIIIGDNTENVNTNKYTSEKIEELIGSFLSLDSLFYNIDWMGKVKNDLIPISTLFNVIRGQRRGWDDLFYPKSGHGIEKEYIHPVIKNSKSVKEYIYNPNPQDAFVCSLTKEELLERKHYGALRWIERFENEGNGTNKPLPAVLKRSDLKWYEMSTDNSMADLITGMNPERRLFWSMLPETSFINQRFVGLQIKEEKFKTQHFKKLFVALLNSIISIFFIEGGGFGRGLGALDFNKDNVERSFMLNPTLLSFEQQKSIIEKFELIGNTMPKDTFIDIEKNKLREEFDRYVLSCFNLEPLYNDIKTSLISKGKARLSVK